MSSYSERAYFDGDHCHHVGAWDEQLRLKRIIKQYQRLPARSDRRLGGRAA